jgi:hypothetical protein
MPNSRLHQTLRELKETARGLENIRHRLSVAARFQRSRTEIAAITKGEWIALTVDGHRYT